MGSNAEKLFDDSAIQSMSLGSARENTFEKNPGIAGLVTDINSAPLVGASVTISGDGKTSTMTTDENG